MNDHLQKLIVYHGFYYVLVVLFNHDNNYVQFVHVPFDVMTVI